MHDKLSDYITIRLEFKALHFEQKNTDYGRYLSRLLWKCYNSLYFLILMVTFEKIYLSILSPEGDLVDCKFFKNE